MATELDLHSDFKILNQQDHQTKKKQGRWYTCTFCRHGFSSAQALGGHMNIHRRQRASLQRQYGQVPELFSLTAITNPPFTFLAPDGLCVFYPNPDQSDVSMVTMEPSSAAFSLVSYPECATRDLLFDKARSKGRTGCDDRDCHDEIMAEELDLELRL